MRDSIAEDAVLEQSAHLPSDQPCMFCFAFVFTVNFIVYC